MLFVMDPEMPLNQFLDNNCEMYCSADKEKKCAKSLVFILNIK